MWDVIGALVESGVSVFLTTQYLEEADRLADRVAVLDGGRIVAEGTPAELKRQAGEQRLELVLADADAFGAAARSLGDRVIASDAGARRLGVATDGSAPHVRALLDELDPGRDAVASFSVHTATLDDVFLALTGHTPIRPEPETVDA
jgi:ABC-2 type transport system ATP-binding protein